MTAAAVCTLGADAVDEAAAVLAEAFADYPTMGWFFEHGAVDQGEALRALLRFFVTARTMRGEVVLGVRSDGTLAAVALVSVPDGGPSPPALAQVRDALWAHVGDAARERYEAYGNALAPLLEAPASMHVNLVGVHPGYRGQGLARRLLDHVHALAALAPDGRGVSLATEDPGNLTLYRRLGYEVTGSVAVADGITAWVLRRPVDPLDVARALAPRLDGLPWAIGGSVLLRHLGLDVRPRDLDLVTTVERFDEVASVLRTTLGPAARPAGGTHTSAAFLRFRAGGRLDVDLMAGLRAHDGDTAREWHLDPATITRDQGVPWSSGDDWVEVYALLGRDARAEQLARHLRQRPDGV